MRTKSGNPRCSIPFLGHGSHTLIAPTIHPDTGQPIYAWPPQGLAVNDAPVWGTSKSLQRQTLQSLRRRLSPICGSAGHGPQEERARFRALPIGYEFQGRDQLGRGMGPMRARALYGGAVLKSFANPQGRP